MTIENLDLIVQPYKWVSHVGRVAIYKPTTLGPNAVEMPVLLLDKGLFPNEWKPPYEGMPPYIRVTIEEMED